MSSKPKNSYLCYICAQCLADKVTSSQVPVCNECWKDAGLQEIEFGDLDKIVDATEVDDPPQEDKDYTIWY